MRGVGVKLCSAPTLPISHCSLTLSLSSYPRPTFLSFPFCPPPHSSSLSLNSAPGLRVSAMASSDSSPADPFAVLFVCLGNICRSPAAEGVFRDIVKKKELSSKVKIDSAGTMDYHEGNPADSRMRSAAKKRGIEITSISRPIRPSDFKEFDLILAMDKQNRADILDAYTRWKQRESLPPNATDKVKLMCSFCKKHKETEVPDPYYGGPQGFEQVLDILEDACETLLHTILAENKHIASPSQ
ncbi:uncharacterized protein LOC18441369 [Amborella trichopoda]|nr:uncharacterized protein LOC18441369 [Amborella trichopoda]|eukprot:XP_006851550.2 uncharacterized protein LOC18441369 [Amborella trichopoda]